MKSLGPGQHTSLFCAYFTLNSLRGVGLIVVYSHVRSGNSEYAGGIYSNLKDMYGGA